MILPPKILGQSRPEAQNCSPSDVVPLGVASVAPKVFCASHCAMREVGPMSMSLKIPFFVIVRLSDDIIEPKPQNNHYRLFIH